MTKSMYQQEQNRYDRSENNTSTEKISTYLGLSQADVYLVRERSTGRSYAIKTLPLRQEAGLPCLNEIDILTRLRHPSLLHAREILRPGQGVADNCIGLVLPLGKWTLNNIIETKILSSQQRVDILWKLSCGLVFLHQQGILHLDLRPDHIILRGCQDKLRPLIADFSCTRFGNYLVLDQLYTSLNYRPPELFFAELYNQPFVYSEKTDVWSLGIIFLEMLTGERKDILPHIAELQSPEKRLVFLQKQLPSEYYDATDLLFRMLDPDPETRLDSRDLLASGFFTTRLNRPLLRGNCKEESRKATNLSHDFLEETIGLLAERFDDFSTAAWQGALNLYSKLGVDDPSIFWVTLFINYKLYDDPDDSYPEFFILYSQLPRDLFLDLEMEIILLQGGCLGCQVEDYCPLSQI